MRKIFRRIAIVACMSMFIAPTTVRAQHAAPGKMSSLLREIVREQRSSEMNKTKRATQDDRTICAFVRTNGDAAALFEEHGCRELARIGDISIADVPLRSLAAMSLDGRVERIEANRGAHALLDSVATQLDVPPVYAGFGLPQAYTGSGVVMGLMDIGFDLTHPNFYNDDATQYRIRRFWDFLSVDTLNSDMYVGAEYTDEEAILAYGCSRNGLRETHGTHTLGIAAGTGYGTHYRGMAPATDICLVSNAVTDDEELIGEDLLYKYTYATDALGFKYIFDYAEAQGQPCVISFSEGSMEDFRGDDVLYYDVLAELVGPGRIIVSSAGNTGHVNNYLHKPEGTERDGAFLSYWKDYVTFTAVADGPFDVRLVVYGSTNDTLTVASSAVAALADSVYTTSKQLSSKQYTVTAEAYTSCYDTTRMAYDFRIEGPWGIGVSTPLSVEVVGTDTEVEYYRMNGNMFADDLNPLLSGGDNTHGINSPSSAPTVICVGATAYRTSFDNYFGETQTFDCGTDGVLANISSRGPTFDERMKPDVLAPGVNVISSMSSYYMEENPDGLADLVETFSFDGRTYGWALNSGTSMSSPAVGGIVALWLEACPTLTPDDVLSVMEHTCTKPPGMSSDRDTEHGYGQIDAYRGLLYILGLDAIEGVSTEQPTTISFMLSNNRTLKIACSHYITNDIAMRFYSVDGTLRLQTSLHGGTSEWEIDLDALPKGVYAVQTHGTETGTTGSTLIRIAP